jgi:hypothetical protein
VVDRRLLVGLVMDDADQLRRRATESIDSPGVVRLLGRSLGHSGSFYAGRNRQIKYVCFRDAGVLDQGASRSICALSEPVGKGADGGRMSAFEDQRKAFALLEDYGF